jgi:outer membrane receptor protein involved in Fe transport
VHGSTSVKEVFGEARIPIMTEGLIYGMALEGGYRQSWYQNEDSKFSTNAYKVALDLSPVRGLRLRASQQRAVRAPNLVELFFPPQLGGFDFDRCAGVDPQATLAQCQATGITPAQYGRILAIPVESGFASYNSVVGGNPNLQPETATTRTLGLVLEPRLLPGFNATVDWWSIDLKGAIQGIGAQAIMDTCVATADPFFCSRIHRDAEGSLWLSEEGFIDDRVTNIASFKVRGVDVAVNYQRRLGRLGSANLSFVGTYVDKWEVDNGGLSEALGCAGQYGGECGTPTPAWRHKARLTWTSRNFDLSGLVTLDRFVLRMGVNNLFDRKPPLLVSGNGACTGGCNGNTMPWFYDALGRYVFAGVTVNLKPF